MMAATKTSPLDLARVAQIAQTIRGAVTPFVNVYDARGVASQAFKDAAQAEVSMRETIMLALADFSQTGQWSAGEVSAAAARAAAMSNNDSAKALATFIGETKRAMHPRVRAHAAALVDLRDQVWDAETAQLSADKDAPKPLRKAFARKYHLLIQMMGAAAEGRLLTTATEVLAWAEACDPNLDVKKVLKRLAGIRETLAAFYHDWPVDDIQVCLDALSEVDARMLRASRAGNVVEITKPAKTPEAVIPEAVKEADEDATPADGAVDVGDLLDDVLGIAEAA